MIKNANSPVAIAGGVLWLVFALPLPAQTWTLESSVMHGIAVAPELEEARQMVAVETGSLEQAGLWPNPRVGLEVSDRLALEQRRGSADLTRFSVTQPLPLGGRIQYRRAGAEASQAAAESAMRHTRLVLEARIARIFHRLQLAVAQYELAQQRVADTEEFLHIARRRREAGDLAEQAQLRVELLHAEAIQALEEAEGNRTDAAAGFSALLGLDPSLPDVAGLQPPPDPEAVDNYSERLMTHPALQSIERQREAAGAAVDEARSARIPDLELTLFMERDQIREQTREVVGVGIGMELPLWDWNRGRIRQRTAELSAVGARRDVMQRDLARKVTVSRLHLSHLIEQAVHQRRNVLEPADRVLSMSRRGFAAGETGLTELIEAHRTRFAAAVRYQELLYRGWLDWADLREAAGVYLDPREVSL
jgi:outer membrane protein, heavy metal efflux system